MALVVLYFRQRATVSRRNQCWGPSRYALREELKGDHLVAIETIGTTLEALGRAEIELPPVSTVLRVVRSARVVARRADSRSIA